MDSPYDDPEVDRAELYEQEVQDVAVPEHIRQRADIFRRLFTPVPLAPCEKLDDPDDGL